MCCLIEIKKIDEKGSCITKLSFMDKFKRQKKKKKLLKGKLKKCDPAAFKGENGSS